MGVTVNISDYTYDLPEERIAKYPLSNRDSSKLLVYKEGSISQRIFRELPELLKEDTLLVFNDTRVVQSRMKFQKQTGSRIEIFCLEPYDPADYNLAFQSGSGTTWKCFVGNAKKWKDGVLHMHFQIRGKDVRLSALKAGRDKDAFLIRFDWDPAEVAFGEILENGGDTPIPPYLNRDAEKSDKNTYQTVYSRLDGSVAAPTAGLHFTDDLLAEISAMQIKKTELTLHVGAGTFQPVIADEIGDHPMHAEHFFISRSSIESLLNHEGNIMAVGTTSTRVLESIFWLGIRLGGEDPGASAPLFLDQWDAYGIEPGDRKSSLENLLGYMDRHGLDSLEGITRLIIVPGYSFRVVDRLLTNYHQPRSTLLLLVSAFIGEDWRRVYDFALKNEFRFLSYGDSSLLIPSK
ncbi:MAG TPA: S-adenosylmethionine:tRNA ribosyltransferase-isomerase [Bacteroides sp.]|nr:S-adenosylmethionine:tRNA ribosyltransferase-isomerase [Bacteroides sp.]